MHHRASLCLSLLLFVAACGDSGPGDPSGSDCKMTAQLNGGDFCGLFLSVERSGGQLFINSGASGQRAIGFTFPDATAGTYTISPGNLVAAGVTIGNDSFAAGQNQGSGTIVITTLTATRVAGTFQLTAVSGNSVATVTQGAFDSDW